VLMFYVTNSGLIPELFLENLPDCVFKLLSLTLGPTCGMPSMRMDSSGGICEANGADLQVKRRSAEMEQICKSN